MKTSKQIQIDKWLGSILNLCLYIPVRILGKVLSINHSLDKPFKRIVIAKYKGMGSIVQASALLKTIRKNYPDAEIKFITTQPNKAILSYYPHLINETLIVNDSSIINLISSTSSLILNLWKFRAEVFIDLEIYSNYGTLISTVSAAKNRLGYYKSDKDYRTGLYTHLMFYNVKSPLSEIYLQTARMLSTNAVVSNLEYPAVKEESVISLKEKLQAHLTELNKYIVINPNASDLRLERRWPSESYVNLIKQLHNKYPDQRIILIGNKAEQTYVESIHHYFENNKLIVNSAGLLSLFELIELIRNAEIIITNDTGPLHLSLALRNKVLGLFGPCSPNQYGQMENCLPLYKNLYCSPCVHEFTIPPCKGNNICMQSIQVSEVIDAFIRLKSNDFKFKYDSIPYRTQNELFGFVQNRKHD